RACLRAAPHRAWRADPVGSGAVPAGAGGAVAERDVATGRVERGRRIVGLRFGARQRDHVHIVRGGGPRPDDPVPVVALLDDGRQDAAGPDAVAAHDQRLLGAVLVEERRLERGRVAGVELEDVADLDRGLEPEAAATLRARVALSGRAQVRPPGLVVAAGLDAADVDAAPVGPRHELALAQRLVGHHLAGEAERPDRAGIGAERGADLVLGRRAEVGA